MSPEKAITEPAKIPTPMGILRMNLLLESFYTKLKDVFVLNEVVEDAAGNKISERANGSGAEVYGITLESNIAPSRDFTAQIGFTYQRSLYTNARSCFDDSSLALSRQMPRTPDLYGYFNLSACLIGELDLFLSGIYTGPMDVPHYAGYVAKDEVRKSESFFELNAKIAYTFRFNNRTDIELNAGVQNIFNSYQDDFDKGENRDAGYVYGPSKPRTISAGVKLSIN
jgi:outer membrane receptor for ferrienterochelin and colicins